MERLKKIDAEGEELKSQIKNIKEELALNTSGEISYDEIVKAMKKLNELLLKTDNQDRKMLIQMVISKITITDNKKIDTIELHLIKI